MDGITFVIFGASGDLTRKKLLPAIHNLVREKQVSDFAVVGIAKDRTDFSVLMDESRKYVTNLDDAAWAELLKRGNYYSMDFYDSGAYGGLGKQLESLENANKLPGKRIFYLATLPEHFDVIARNIRQNRLAKDGGEKWARLVFEKPFGHDLKSAREINNQIGVAFNEKQIFRIDHYLGKEFVENISLIRFTNRILEPLWCNQHIDSIQIILTEDFGIENRGAFYDRYGALKDVVQNHALQLLALVAMEPPKKLIGEYLRKEKAKVLKNTAVADSLFGQYRGYLNERGVAPGSKTETFAALSLRINNPRWRGVRFYIKAGKSLDRKQSSIVLKFKHTECLLLENCPMDSNYFKINIAPRKSFAFEINSKIPERGFAVQPVQMEFSQNMFELPNSPDAYENLLLDVMGGDHSFFVGKEEVEYSWKIVDLIKKQRPFQYEKGSNGPKELASWNSRNKIIWKG